MFPDPMLSANLYASGRLDEAIRGVAGPLRDALREAAGDDAYLWLLRYSRGGRHLKLRLHGPAQVSKPLRQTLRKLAESFLEEVPAAEGERLSAPSAPPLDVEDDVAADHPDRCLLFTTYRRSPVTMGGGPLPEDDGFAARFTAAAGRATDQVLELFADDEAPGASARQRTLMLRIVDSLHAAGLDSVRQAAYYKFHRDWLVRFPLYQRPDRLEQARRVLEVYAGRAERMGPFLEALTRYGAEARTAEPTAWSRAVRELARYTEGFADDPAADHDPYATGPLFPALFKVHHNLANQLGIAMPHEAGAYDLLLRAAPASGGYDLMDLPFETRKAS